jgi:hypothetical protein
MTIDDGNNDNNDNNNDNDMDTQHKLYQSEIRGWVIMTTTVIAAVVNCGKD